MSKRIAVTGASGHVGREVTKCLQQLSLPNRLLTRDLDHVKHQMHPTSDAVVFDYNRPETYEEALEGVSRVFLVCQAGLQKNLTSFLEAAKNEGIEQFVIMSGIASGINHNHFLWELEQAVKQANIPYVALRGNWFFQNFDVRFAGMVKDKHELAFPDGGQTISFVDTRDIAEVAAHFLGQGIVESQAMDVTGSESLSHKDLAQIFTSHLPYTVAYKEISEKEAQELFGWGEEMLELYRDIRNGYTAPVSDAIESVLGKKPRRFEDYVVENLKLWT